MNIPNLAIKYSRITYFILAIMLFGGIIAFDRLAKKEDAPFVIKQAVLMCSYPGASPLEVEELITEPIEREVQSMQGVKSVRSESFFALSKITVELLPSISPADIPQKWDELRRKTLNIQSKLPSGASEISVSDDFGDVFGIYYGLTRTEGVTLSELRDWAETIKQELVTVDGVQKVALYGVQQEVVNIYIPLSTLSTLAISPQEIQTTIESQNRLLSSGVKEASELSLRVDTKGSYQSLDELRSQVVTTGSGAQVILGDIAEIEFGYHNPPSTLMMVNNQDAIGIGISTQSDRDVVKTGVEVEKRLQDIVSRMPIGIELVPLYLENQIAQEANNQFILNLFESLLIVIVLILLIMGFRAGLLIGSSLLFSIGGTMLLMLFWDTGLNRTSLAGFIIAMGMLVDNAIVVTDNAQNGILKGMSRYDALNRGASQPMWGLLGATFIAICSFLPLYLAPSATAEIVKPLFVVLAISLLLSWGLALTQTPLFGNFILRKTSKSKNNDKANQAVDIYDNRFYRGFNACLFSMIRYRWITVSLVVVMLIGAVILMNSSPKSFFPLMDKPYFRADCFLPDGYSIQETRRQTQKFAQWISQQPEVKQISMTVGSSPLRYYLASTSIGPKPNCANLLVELHDASHSSEVELRAALWAKDSMPDMLVRSSLFKLSPAVEATIEIGFIGKSIDTLEMLCYEAMEIMQQSNLVGDIRSSWGNKVAIITPRYSQINGQRLGVGRHLVASYLNLSTIGMAMSEFRKGDQFMPILLKDASIDDFNLANLGSVPLYTPYNGVISIMQVLDIIDEHFEYSVVKRYNRERVLMAQCDPLINANAAQAYDEVYDAVVPKLEQKLPKGYSIKIFGEQESQQESNSALAENVPLTFILIFVTLLLLFNSYRKPLVILLMLPLILIGVVAGLALSGKTLDFFAILGLLGLIGMNIKNAVVLLDEISLQTEAGVAPLTAVLGATTSRIVPVVMASGTTILGMVPLLSDALFGSMAATIMGGLFVSTLLTIFILPVTYCLIMRIS